MADVCRACPRKCGVERPFGFCHAPEDFLVARIALHEYEEPPISGVNGSGTVFFGGCNLGCVYCQNMAISRGGKGTVMSRDELEKALFSLCRKGVHNINFVTPGHYLYQLASFLKSVKPHLSVPVVCNCGGYEDVSALKALEGLVDVYLPDLKYFSSELSLRYSHAADYFEVASAAISEMYRQQPKLICDGQMLTGGVMVRHLVLPGQRKDSIRLLEELSKLLPTDAVLLSLMSQYTPDFVDKSKYPELGRRVTTFEYDSVAKRAKELGFNGFYQLRSSADAKYTPDFSEDIGKSI